MGVVYAALRIHFVVFFTVLQAKSAYTETVTITTIPDFPENYNNVTIVCKSPSPSKYFYHEGVFLTGCNQKSCLPSHHSDNRYYFTSDEYKAVVTVPSLDRIRDQGFWTCSSSVNRSLNLIVYSFPRSLMLIHEGNAEKDLEISDVTLQCQTDVCTYPAPSGFSWFYKQPNSATWHIFSGREFVTITTTEGNCTEHEKLYISTLMLPRNMKMPANSGATIVFTCGINYTDTSRTLYSSVSRKIRFPDSSDVNVRISMSALKNKTTVLICEARGFPANSKFYPWVHMWQHQVIRTDLQGVNNSTHSVLYIDSLVLENIGTYICSASNGLSDDNSRKLQMESKYLNFTGIKFLGSTTHTFAGGIGQSLNISIPFYIDPAVESFHIHARGMLVTNTSNTISFISRENISYQMYSTTVHLGGQVVHLIIQNLSQSDFGNYSIVLNNYVCRSVLDFQLTIFGSPHKVERFYFNTLQDKRIEMHFVPGFNGGLDQTFNIEYTCDGLHKVWQNTSTLTILESKGAHKFKNGTYAVTINVTTLPPGICLYRIYSWNVYGNSPYSDIVAVLIPNGIETFGSESRYPYSFLIITAVVCIAFIAGVNICQKRRKASLVTALSYNIQRVSMESDNVSATATHVGDVIDTEYESPHVPYKTISNDQNKQCNDDTTIRSTGASTLYANTLYTGDVNEIKYESLQERSTEESPYQRIGLDQTDSCSEYMIMRSPETDKIYMNTENAFTHGDKGYESLQTSQIDTNPY